MSASGRGKVMLLDCTLRDGGYHNDWAFGRDAMTGVFERVVSAGVDFLELGFLDQRRPFDPSRTIAPDTASLARLFGRLDRKRTRLVGMIDFGTCDLAHVQPRSESVLDGIRVIFKKHLRAPALEFCRALKARGYLVFAQLVSITSYSDEEMMDLIRLVDDVKPFAVSMVDTYGLLHKDRLFHYYELLERHVDRSVAIGYHSHNNFQLAYANSIELINRHRGSDRSLICDGSLFGMGKGAGNAPTELLCMHLNETAGRAYDVGQLLEAIDADIRGLYDRYHWGYSLKAFLAASNDCHPNYVAFLVDKKTLSIKSVNEILQLLEGDRKLLYDQSYIEDLYVAYQRRNSLEDAAVYDGLRRLFAGRPVLLVGPGGTIVGEHGRIADFIRRTNPFVLALNYIPARISPHALLVTNSKRYNQQVTAIGERQDGLKLIATSNLTRTNGSFDFTIDYESLIDRDAVFVDNSFLMALKMLRRAAVSRVALAGFDGYALGADSYFSSEMEYDFVRRMGAEINAQVNAALPALRRDLSLTFITSTVYEAQ